MKFKTTKILGKNYVLTNKEERIMYATDSTAVSTDLYLPDYVLMPENEIVIDFDFLEFLNVCCQ